MIEIIDLLKPKNGGSFKLIEDIDIAVNGYSSLADCVAHMATTAMIEAINLALSGKQDKLTTAQLTAVNSGITSELVAQITANATAIAGKADAADLAALESEVDTKADASDLTTATTSLQNQINNIVSGSTADSEVINARVGSDGTSYSTLKERCDATDNHLKETNEAFSTTNDSALSCIESLISLDNQSSLQFPIPVYLNHGSIRNTSISNPTSSTTAVYSTPNAADKCETVFTVKTGYKFLLVLHNNNGNYARMLTDQWQTGTYTLTQNAISALNGLISVEIQRTDAGNITLLPYDALTITKNTTNAIKSHFEALEAKTDLYSIERSQFTVDNTYIRGDGYASNNNFASTDFLPINNATYIKFFKTSAQGDGYTIAFYEDNTTASFISGVLLDNISSPEVVNVPTNANYFICSVRKTGEFEASATTQYSNIVNEVANARTSASGTKYINLKSRIDAVENAVNRAMPVGENIVTTFDKSVLTITKDNAISYDGTALAQTHQNYAFIKKSKDVNCFTFGFKGYSARCGIQLYNGDYVYIVIANAEGYFGVTFYDKNTTAIGSTVYVNSNIPWTSATTEHHITVSKNGNYILVYIDGILLGYTTSKIYNQNVRRIGYAFRSGEAKEYTEITTSEWKQYAHISFDDQNDILKALTVEGVTSIYDVNEFATLKDLHQNYGCTFTLMLFYEKDSWDISQLPTTFKNEFIAASDWLKFAYHSHDDSSKASDLTEAELITDMELMYTAIRSFADESCIDYCPRLGFFNCTKAQAIAIAEAGLVTGLLTADDVRSVNVGLTAQEKPIMENTDRMYDYANAIMYARSRIRLDQLTAEQVVTTLNSQYNRNNATAYEIFSHGINATALEAVANWINKKCIRYGFAMDNIDF